jgi:hypothetical protein
MRLRAIVLAGVLFCGLVSSASATSLRRLVPSVRSFASDGGSYAAWQVAATAPIVVLDTRTRSRRAIPVPGCTLSDQLRTGVNDSAGKFLLSCSNGVGREQRLLDAQTGISSPLPAGEGPPIRVGVPPQQVCPLLRSSMLAQMREGVLAEQLAYQDAIFVHPSSNHRDVSIERCDGHSTLLPGPDNERTEPGGVHHSEPRSFDLGAGLLTWDTAHPASGADMNEQSNAHGTLSSYRLATRRRRTWKLPRLPIHGVREIESPGVYGYSTHTANTIFWIASRTVTVNTPTSALTVQTSTIYATQP